MNTDIIQECLLPAGDSYVRLLTAFPWTANRASLLHQSPVSMQRFEFYIKKVCKGNVEDSSVLVRRFSVILLYNRLVHRG